VQSCLYEGVVRHQRASAAGAAHSFDFPLFLVYLDLAELPEVFRGRWLWSATRPAPARFCREDHLGDPRIPLDAVVRDRVEARRGIRPTGPIRLLTHLRYFGYVFNPVILFYCFDDAGERVESVVAEVSNTPWNERHCYVLTPEEDHGRGRVHRWRTPKAFHVSPFLGMDYDYAWTVREPEEHLSVVIRSLPRGARNGEGGGEGARAASALPRRDEDAGGAAGAAREARCDRRGGNAPTDPPADFDAALVLRRRALSTASLTGVLLRYPLMTARTIARIYAEAWRLRRKGAPVHDHPGRVEAPAEVPLP